MVTDRPPRTGKALTQYRESEQLKRIELPAHTALIELAQAIERVMKEGTPAQVRQACAAFLTAAAAFYGVAPPEILALAPPPTPGPGGGWRHRLVGALSPNASRTRT